MACRLPHTVEELQNYIKKQAEQEDEARQHALVEVIKQFEVAKAQKQKLRQQYEDCKDISEDRKAVIDQFLNDEARKDGDISETLWGCVSQIQGQISNKIRWSYEENVEARSVSKRSRNFDQGASTSSVAPRFVAPGSEDNSGWDDDKEREFSRLEAEYEESKFANYSAYDDGYDSDNSETWDNPNY